jgi:hypothetical protein
MMRFLLPFGSALIVATGCDNGERISRLEKQNQELQAEIKKRDAVAEYDLPVRRTRGVGLRAGLPLYGGRYRPG